MNKNLLSIAIILLAVALVFINIWKPNSKEEITSTDTEGSIDVPASGTGNFNAMEGEMALDFQLTTLHGETVNLSDYKGKKVILNFWATWCPPCIAEMPHMQKFYQKNKDDGVEILAVNLTNIDKGKDAIINFVDEYGLAFTIPLDEEGEVGAKYQAFTIPTSYIIDTKGIIRKKIIGPMDEEMMANLINSVD